MEDVSNYIRGSFPQPYTNRDFFDEKDGKPFVQIADIGFDLKLNEDTKAHISKIAQSNSRFAKAGTVVVALQGSIEKSIGRTAITQYDAYFDRTILIFQDYKVPIDIQYFAQVIENLFAYEKNKAWGATISTITKTHLNKFIIGLPQREEQERIGQFLKHLNNTITLHQRKLEQLQVLKQAYLRQMFPSGAERTPTLRFANFTDNWEQRKLGNEVLVIMGQSPNGENYTDNPNDHILVQGNADMKNGRVTPRVWTTQITKTAEPDDIILSVRAPVGDVGKTDHAVVLGRGVAGIKGSAFIFQTLLRMKETGYWTRYSTGSTFESIKSADLKEAVIQVPNLEEQSKIGVFFTNLDKTITLHQHKLEQIQKLKQAYLQKMFI